METAILKNRHLCITRHTVCALSLLLKDSKIKIVLKRNPAM